MIKHFSHSSLSTAWGCLEAFRLKYMCDKPPEYTNTSLLTGVAAHEGLAAAVKHYMESNGSSTCEECPAAVIPAVIDKHWPHWHPTDVELVIPANAIRDRIELDAIRAAEYWVKKELPTRSPVACETAFELTHPDWWLPVVGRLDLVEKGLVTDFKVTKRTPDQDAAEISDQLTLYALAYYAETGVIPDVQLDFIVLTERTHLVPRFAKRTMDDLLRMVDRITATQDTVHAMCYDASHDSIAPPLSSLSPAVRGKWGKCKSTTCDFYKVCSMGAGKPVSTLDGLKSVPTKEEVDDA